MTNELGLSTESLDLLLNKPPAWGYLLFAQLLEESLVPFLMQRQEDASPIAAPEIIAEEDFDIWFGSRNAELQESYLTLNAFLQRIHGWAKDQHTTEAKNQSTKNLSIQDGLVVGEVRSFVSVFVSAYLAAVQHQNRLRRVHVADLYQTFLGEASKLPNAFLDALEFCPQDIREQVQTILISNDESSIETLEELESGSEHANADYNKDLSSPNSDLKGEVVDIYVEFHILVEPYNTDSYEFARTELLRSLGHDLSQNHVSNDNPPDVDIPELLSFLEKYLLREGLQNIIPKRRHPYLFNPPIVSFYFLALLCLPLIGLLNRHGGVPFTFIFPVVLLVAGLFVVILPFGIKHILSKTAEVNPNLAIFALGIALPLWMAIGTAIQMQSFLIFWVCFASNFLLFIALGLFTLNAVWFSQIWSNARITIHIAQKSLTLLPLLVPQLLIVALFPLFSAELWQVLTGISFKSIGWLAVGFTVLFSILVWSQRHVADELVWSRSFETASFFRHIRSVPWLKQYFEAHLVSPEEFFELREQLEWRDPIWLIKDVLPRLRSRVRQVVFGVTLTNALAVWFLFSLLLFSFFYLALSPEVLDSWIHPDKPTWTERTTMERQIGISPVLFPISIPTLLWVRLKVSILLGLFLAAFSVGFTLTDEKVQGRYKEWLERDLDWWFSASACYIALAHPDYHIWNYLKKKDGIANLDIVLRPELEEISIRTICEVIGEHHTEYKKLVIIRAHVKQEEEYADYNIKASPAWWQWVHNKTNNHRSFTMTRTSDEDMQIYLGDACLQSKTEIPDEWFGSCPEIGRSIWNSDLGHRLVLRPIADQQDNNFIIKVHIKKRLLLSKTYRKLIRKYVSCVEQIRPQANMIQIEVFLREDPDVIASFILNKDQSFVQYSDEYMVKRPWFKKLHTAEKLNNWLDG